MLFTYRCTGLLLFMWEQLSVFPRTSCAAANLPKRKHPCEYCAIDGTATFAMVSRLGIQAHVMAVLINALCGCAWYRGGGAACSMNLLYMTTCVRFVGWQRNTCIQPSQHAEPWCRATFSVVCCWQVSMLARSRNAF